MMVSGTPSSLFKIFNGVKLGMNNFLIGYIDHYRFFQVVPEFIRVFGEDYCMNNYLELFHSTLLMQIGHD